jgi:uncharacterized protein YndB with AHSA1/START domain
MSQGDDRVSASLTVDAPVEVVFDLLADPATHASIDGTGWVCGAVDTEPLTAPGQVFTMAMHHPDHPDGDYRTANRVEVLDRPRAISWHTGYAKDDGTLGFGGWLWRYDLRPLSTSSTEVTLSYDWSAVPASIREYLSFPPFPPDHLSRSLAHLAQLATAPGLA